MIKRELEDVILISILIWIWSKLNLIILIQWHLWRNWDYSVDACYGPPDNLRVSAAALS